MVNNEAKEFEVFQGVHRSLLGTESERDQILDNNNTAMQIASPLKGRRQQIKN